MFLLLMHIGNENIFQHLTRLSIVFSNKSTLYLQVLFYKFHTIEAETIDKVVHTIGGLIVKQRSKKIYIEVNCYEYKYKELHKNIHSI